MLHCRSMVCFSSLLTKVFPRLLFRNIQRQDYKLRMQGKSSRLTDERMKLLNDLGFQWHISRKGRKIKLNDIPVIRREDRPDSKLPALTSPGGSSSAATGGGGGGGVTAGRNSSAGAVATGAFQPSTAANIVGQNTGHLNQGPAAASKISSSPGTSIVPGFSSLPNFLGGNAGNNSNNAGSNLNFNVGYPWSQLPPAPPSQQQQQLSTAGNFDLNTLLSLQRALSGVTSTSNSTTAINNPQQAIGVGGNFAFNSQTQQSNQTQQQQYQQQQSQNPLSLSILQSPQQQQQQQGPPLAAILVPIQIGDLLGLIQQQGTAAAPSEASSGVPGGTTQLPPGFLNLNNLGISTSALTSPTTAQALSALLGQVPAAQPMMNTTALGAQFQQSQTRSIGSNSNSNSNNNHSNVPGAAVSGSATAVPSAASQVNNFNSFLVDSIMGSLGYSTNGGNGGGGGDISNSSNNNSNHQSGPPHQQSPPPSNG